MNFIIIPEEIKINEDLTPFCKILFWEILSLVQQTWVCFASIEYFTEVFSVKKSTIYQSINVLKNMGYIRGEIWNLSFCEHTEFDEFLKKIPLRSEQISKLMEGNSENLESSIYSIIYKIIKNLVDRKKIEKEPSKDLIDELVLFFANRVELGQLGVKCRRTYSRFEKIVLAMCKEKYECVAIAKIDRAIDCARRSPDYDMDEKEIQSIIEREKERIKEKEEEKKMSTK